MQMQMFYSFFRKCKTQIFFVSPCLTFLQNPIVVVRYGSTIPSNEPSFTASYLVNSCGFSLKSALALSKRIHFESPEKADSVISFFKNHGFSQTQIRNLISKRRPNVLSYDPDTNLLPKFQFFYSKGISSSELATILSSNSIVLGRNLHNCIIPNFNSFKDFTHFNDIKIFRTYKHCSAILNSDIKSVTAPNRAVLKEYGLPESTIMTTLVSHPRMFLAKHARFRRAVEEVKKLGFDPLKAHFLTAVRALLPMSKSTWKKKSNVLKQWGWSDADIVSAFKKYPMYIICSEHRITAVMNFVVNTMGLKSSYMASHPSFFGYSIERRMIPRWSVISTLFSKRLIEKITFSLPFVYTEKKFLETFVTPYQDPHLLKLYKEKLGL